jgi:hypothetical protein
MQKVSKLQAESLILCGYRVKKTKFNYYLLGNEVKTKTGYVDFL